MEISFRPHAFPTPPLDSLDIAHILKNTEHLWPELRGKRVFITGGTGFFGHWLLESFLAANSAFHLQSQAVVLTRSPEDFHTRSPHIAQNASVELVKGDISEFQFPSGEFPFVIHAAAESVPARTALPMDEFSAIVDGTRRCLEFAESHHTRKFLFTSSGAVYGAQPSQIAHLSEGYLWKDDADAPNRAYREGKRMAERLCLEFAARSGMECKIARCFAFVGPHLPLNAHFAIGNFIRDALADKPIEIRGDGTPRRSYLYAADLAIWLWTILFRAPSSRPFNVGSNHDFSIREIAELVVATVRPGLAIHVAQQTAAGDPIQRYVPSVEAAKKELKLVGAISLTDAIQRTANWYRAQ